MSGVTQVCPECDRELMGIDYDTGVCKCGAVVEVPDDDFHA